MKLTMLVLAALFITPAAALAQGPSTSIAAGPQLELGQLDRLATTAADTVNITIDPAMLQLLGSILGNNRGNDAAALFNDIRGVYVRSFEFDREHAYAPGDVDAVRTQLAAPGWSKLMEVAGRRDGETVEIYSWREGNRSAGLAILIAGPRELTIVNIVGSIDLTRLRALQGQFGIPQLPDGPR